MSAHLELLGVDRAFGATRALDAVSLTVEHGSVHALLGGNGSGKSTLIKVLAGVVVADAGELVIDGREYDLSSHRPARAHALGLRFVHQQNSTFPTLSVAENLSLGRGYETKTGRIRWPAVRKRTARVLERFEIPANPHDLVGELSPATQMMIATARVLQDEDEQQTSLLVLDEATASLPRHEVELLLSALRRYAEWGQTILFVTHRLEEVMAIADAGTILRDGRVVGSFRPRDTDHDELVTMIMGEPVKAVAKRRVSATTPGRVLLRATGLGNGQAAVELHSGEVVGLAGILGSGRSAIARQLFGVETPRDSAIEIDGRHHELSHSRDAIRAGIALIPENRVQDAMFVGSSVTDNISIAYLESHTRFGRISRRSERRAAGELMQRLKVVAASPDTPIGALSGGNQQKVILARWLQRRPKVLLLDEPTQGVDAGARAEIHALIRAAVDAGAGAIFISSDSEELAMVCTRVLVVRGGAIVAELTGDDIDETRINATIYENGASR